MTSYALLRWALICTCAVLGVLLLMILALTAAVDAGHLRRPLVNLISSLCGRQIRVDGKLATHLLSAHPSVVAEGVSIGNPSWTPPGITAHIGRLTLTYVAPGIGHWLKLDSLSIEGAHLSLTRDAAGSANWQTREPPQRQRSELALFRSLSVPDATVTLTDERRHLHYQGTISVDEVTAWPGAPAVRIAGSGQLNDADVSLSILGDPLVSASRTQPYRFRFEEYSKQAHLTGHGELEHAFSFDRLHASFESSGDNLKDLYQLAGVSLINTGRYEISGLLTRQGRISTFTNLLARSGVSDVQGSVSVEVIDGRPQLVIDLHSDVLRLSDLGERAARANSNPLPPSNQMFSSVALQPPGIRRTDVQMDFKARQLQIGRLPLQNLKAKLLIEHGILSLAPVNAQLLAGELSVRFRMDAATDTPVSTFDLQLKGAQVGQLDSQADGRPRIDAPLAADIHVTGRGASLHQIAASASGSVQAVLSSGTIRSSLAELSAGDVRGFEMLLTRSQKQSALRCGIAAFDANDGKLTARRVMLDTEPVLINGDGDIDLDSEQLHLTLQGQPRNVRLLRVKAPIALEGFLLHPKIALARPASVKFIDRGQARNTDCATLSAR